MRQTQFLSLWFLILGSSSPDIWTEFWLLLAACALMGLDLYASRKGIL